ncbi:monocarboxylate transporter 6-like isoform X1 [Saccostrea echinata]|uniref:monocarboxylate transporter 6-like isoform X1 n=1 Tax=Saccostrea echinata TaxID=191078 RepID=UPI002A825E20|nr:monocarboxylate transporter 6-like isoform X1 [Saccostrea echinata]
MTTKKRENSEPLRERYDKTNRRYIVFVGCLLIQFVAIAMPSSMLGIVYVDVTREFDAEASEAALMLSLFRGIAFGGGVIGEMVIRRVGEFPCIIAASLVGSISILASAFAQSMTAIVLLIGVGTGCACVFPTLLSYVYISRSFPRKYVSKFLIMMTVGAGLGLLTTPYMTEFFLRQFGWRGTFMMASGLFFHLFLVGIVVQFNLPPLDGPRKAKEFKWTDQIAIFKNRTYSIYLFDMLLFGIFGYVVPWFLPDFVVSNNYTKQDAALLLTISGVSNLVGRILAGTLDPFFSRTKIIYHWGYIFAITAVSFAVFPFFMGNFSVLCGASLVYGTCFGLIVSQSVPIVVQALPLTLTSIGMATEFTAYGLCTVLGGYVCGLIRDVTGGYDAVFYMSSGTVIVCSFMCVLLLFLDKTCKRKTLNNVHINTISIISHL